MTDIIGALGAVIGYLGAEVAEKSLFNRLLWPQRYYNHASAWDILTLTFLMPMGGPLHRAALETLDQFRENGLYRGRCRGHMLGSAFFHQQDSTYSILSSDILAHQPKEVRNGMWVQVLKMIDRANLSPEIYRKDAAKSRGDVENQPLRARQRSRHLVFQLRLSLNTGPAPRIFTVFEEGRYTFHILGGIFMSEVSAIAVALLVGVWQRTIWLAVYFCVPLVLKLLALVLSVRREHLTATAVKRGDATGNALADEGTTALFEVHKSNDGFMLIESPPEIMFPFFRHYGHPIRTDHMDRFRELCGIFLVYAFVCYFPAGLLGLLWLDETSQYIWLGYQTYTIIVMHITRLFGYEGVARTEKRMAELLQQGASVVFKSGDVEVLARLRVEEVASYALAKERVRDILKSHVWSQNLAANTP
ncbi:hypothetical protein ABW19_dt0206901 [Dactylella cylindrospora]|nr:hypothetical protein ABW19_dt0206901 [Dactylella cylindrospora]